MPQHTVQFARTRDGVMIAYRTVGQGLPLLFLTGWVSHLESELAQESVARFTDQLAGHGRRRLVRVDFRGTGLSDRDVGDVSAPARALDIEAVVDELGGEKVVIFAWALSTPPAIVYAATHPERVSHLILYSSLASPITENQPLLRALIELIRADWNVGSRTLVQVVSPGGGPEDIEYGSQYARLSATGEHAAALLEEALFRVDVREYAQQLTMPTLVLHRREDAGVPFAAGREVAALVPDAHFVLLSGTLNSPFSGDADAIIRAVDDFLGVEEGAPEAVPGEAHSGLLTILFTDLVGSTAFTERLGDEAAQDVLRTHNAIIRERLREHGGSELKALGDGFMASFPSASRAIECSIAIQKAFTAYNDGRPADGQRIQVRIGLNAGEPVPEDEDLFGTAVQAAARIAARAEAGQILVADVVRQLAAGKGFQFVKRGRVHLKGFRERFRLFEVPT